MASNKASISTVVSEQEQIATLEELKKKVKAEAFYMKRALDNSKMLDALKFASNMTSQLMTGKLGPKHYYSLYLAVFDELRYLESALMEEKQRGERLSKLYELVQYVSNVLPRLYLLVTVGSAFIKSKEVPAKDVLGDLVEMCKGVQHPLRGLFLRNYLSEMTKDKLPDIGSDDGGAAGSVTDSIEFIVLNFTEMNKLWVRMQHMGASIDREKRESERIELHPLIGKNLSRLSSLDGVDLSSYETVVLPRVLEQIASCKDQIAQQYLVEGVIQAFPDEYHIATLNRLLEVFNHLQVGVDIRQILVSLIDRLANFGATHREELSKHGNLFALFHSYFKDFKKGNSKPEELLQIPVSLANFTAACFPDQLDQLDQTLETTAAMLTKLKEEGVDISKPLAVRHIVKLLTLPLDTYKNVLLVLQLPNFSAVLSTLSYQTRKRVCVDIVTNAVDNKTKLSSAEEVVKLFDVVSLLVKDQPDQPADDALDMEDFENEQNLMASLVHLFNTADPRTLFSMYNAAKAQFIQETSKSRIKYTLPSLVFGLLRLSESIVSTSRDASEKVYLVTSDVIKELKENSHFELALRLYMQSALSAVRSGFDQIAYDLICQAFIIYEEELAGSKAQASAIKVITGCLQVMNWTDKDLYDTLITRTAVYSNKQLLKPDQCRAVANCSHLFWTNTSTPYRDGDRVLECLKKALKTADGILEQNVKLELFIEILNKCLYFYANGNQSITAKYIVGCIRLINGNMEGISSTSEIAMHFNNTLKYIEWRKTNPADEGNSFSEINLESTD